MTPSQGAEGERPGPGEVTIDDAVEIAVRAQKAGDHGVAEAVYQRILTAVPDHADALHFYGVLHHQTRRPQEAVRLIRRAIEVGPDNASMHINLGNVLFEIDRPDLARRAYEMAVVLEPGNADVRNNLGVALRALRQVDDAEAAYREAVALDPRHRDAWNNLGRLLSGRGRLDEASACHATALELSPRDADTRRFLAHAYAASAQNDRALAILRDWHKDDPGNPHTTHLIAAISGENVPERASDQYVESLFDAFAASFDRKLATLDYRAPELVASAVAAAYPIPGADLAILDAGCGTGLCGEALRPFARVLDGVDLSEKMLERAGERGGYDALHHAELTAYLAEHPGAYDLVVSADTLCYFGNLAPVCLAAHGTLRAGGRLVFSVEEAASEEGHALQNHGRYSHALAYVARTLAEAGFTVETTARDTLRMERGEAVRGLIVTARRP